MSAREGGGVKAKSLDAGSINVLTNLWDKIYSNMSNVHRAPSDLRVTNLAKKPLGAKVNERTQSLKRRKYIMNHEWLEMISKSELCIN